MMTRFFLNRRFFVRFAASFSLALLLMVGQSGILAAIADSNPDVQSIEPYLERAKSRVTEFQLDNGLTFIVMENHEAPVISFVTYADVGGVDEPDGKTGVAHFLEHLAFKGTRRIGTTNYTAEAQLLEKLDQLKQQIRTAEQANRKDALPKLEAAFAATQAEAWQYVQQNQFGQIVQQSGGRNLNAQTSADATTYFYSFPSNKLELWMSLESERFLEPVFREFYKEQQVILEERQSRTENSPIGQMVEKFLGTAFTKHPYGRPVIGYKRDISNLSRKDVQQFFEAYYPPSNLTIAIVGDVDPQQVKQLAQVYFGRFPQRPKPLEIPPIEPPQTETREVSLELVSQPWYFEGYHRPAMNHPDNAVYEVIAALMSNGRTSRLYKSLVQEQQLALAAQGFNGFPGDKYPNLILFYAMTAPGKTIEEVAAALRQEIEQLKVEPVSETALNRIKTQQRAALIRSLDSNLGMAKSLVEYQVKTGSWQNLFQQIAAIAAVTPADIQRIAQKTFTSENRTIGRLMSQNDSQ